MLKRVTDLSRRKLRHIEACLLPESQYQTRSAGFAYFDLPYRALPESNLAALNTRAHFLGKALSFPFLIGAMTGGTERASVINKRLAEAAELTGVGLMLGSQRVMLERPSALASFTVRAYAPTALLIGNLGVAQLNKGYGAAQLRRAVDLIGADALALHTNPLQEALQTGGDTDFSRLIEKLERIVPELPYPVLLKEVGHGLSAAAANSVKNVGFAALDVAGAGGTSWARVEELVEHGVVTRPELCDWGVPTVTALREVRAVLPGMPLIASGGVRSGLDMAKALALGAQVVAVARPLLEPALKSTEAVIQVIEGYRRELSVTMHCAGARDLRELAGLELLPV